MASTYYFSCRLRCSNQKEIQLHPRHQQGFFPKKKLWSVLHVTNLQNGYIKCHIFELRRKISAFFIIYGHITNLKVTTSQLV